MNRRVGWPGLLSWVLAVGCGASGALGEDPVVSADTGADSPSSDAEPRGVVEGTVMATYATGELTGTFHAELCPNGQGY